MQHEYKTFEEIDALIHCKADLLARGISERRIQQRVRAGQTLALRPGVYISRQVFDSLGPWEKYCAEIIGYQHAAMKRGKAPIFSHQSAAVVQGLWLVRRPPPDIHIYSLKGSRGPAYGVKKHVQGSALPDSVLGKSGLYTTSIFQTVLDCARSLPLLEALPVADSALCLGYCSQPDLKRFLLDYRGISRLKVDRVAALMSDLAESPGETLTRYVIADLGVPYLEQAKIFVAGREYRVDFLLPDFNLIIEFDGAIKYTQFGDPSQVEQNERVREKKLQNMGYLVYRTSWNDVLFNPKKVKREILALMRR